MQSRRARPGRGGGGGGRALRPALLSSAPCRAGIERSSRRPTGEGSQFALERDPRRRVGKGAQARTYPQSRPLVRASCPRVSTFAFSTDATAFVCINIAIGAFAHPT